VLGDEQFHAGGGLVYVPDGAGGTVPMVATPADFSATPVEIRCSAPTIGEHSGDLSTGWPERH
jgi:crotonobetainyl-CoA:carnitine CoA-transferase CaiB-like acyl-CoA transferase